MVRRAGIATGEHDDVLFAEVWRHSVDIGQFWRAVSGGEPKIESGCREADLLVALRVAGEGIVRVTVDE